VKKRYWVVENERERKKKQKRVKGKQTDRPTEKLTKANKKQSMEEMQKRNKERESCTKWESLRHINQCPELFLHWVWLKLISSSSSLQFVFMLYFLGMVYNL
jgi:Flp pilus assembly protein TadB